MLTNDHHKEALVHIYLDYRNNYLTIETMSEHYMLDPAEMTMLVEQGRTIHKEIVDNA